MTYKIYKPVPTSPSGKIEIEIKGQVRRLAPFVKPIKPAKEKGIKTWVKRNERKKRIKAERKGIPLIVTVSGKKSKFTSLTNAALFLGMSKAQASRYYNGKVKKEGLTIKKYKAR